MLEVGNDNCFFFRLTKIQGGTRIVRMGRYQVAVGGDVITAIDGQLVDDMEAWTIYLETQTAIGDTVNITLIRDGKEQTIPVVLAERPGE